MHRHHTQKGFLLVLVLVFGGIFFMMASAFIGYVITQSQVSQAKYNKERALDIAEAGLDYYKWYLAHNPNDTTNGTGTVGPYVHTYNDPEGDAIGEFSLDIASSTACGDVYAMDITSTGYTYDNPNIERIVYGRYARPTVAEFAYIINSNVWAGADRVIVGPYHSNGGIRMDGTNNSTVTSGQETWSCTSSYGCSPTNNSANGVLGSGPNDELWSFPSTPINFTGITVDLAAMQDKAQNHGGRYFGPSGGYGYRVVFKTNGTIDVYRVTNTTSYWGYSTEDGWQSERHVISASTLLGNYTVPSACSIIYVEDKVWLEGVVNGKVTITAADVDTAGVDPRIILNSSITYANATSGLLAIAEDDVLVGLSVPDDMILNGIFVAQNGRFGRNHYCQSECDGSHGGSEGLPSSLDPYHKRDTLTVNGTIVSNGREGTKWTSGGVYTSGFNTRYNSYDRDLVSDPPPLTPDVSDTYEFIEWREEN
jgi:hypothetical protein